MNKVELKDIKPISVYDEIRDFHRKQMMDLKDRRRVQVSDRISLLFENRTTVIDQIQEMCRAEKLSDPRKVQAEIDVYNELVPEERELVATLFIEIEDPSRMKEELGRLLGIDQGEHVFLEAGGAQAAGVFAQGYSTESDISAVHFVRFKLPEEIQAAIRSGSTPVRIVVDHPNYHAVTVIGEETREELARDLGYTS